MKVGIIGAGKLGKAIMDGLKDKEVEISASGQNKRTHNGIDIITDNKKVIEDSDVIILTVKPQSMEKVLYEIKDRAQDKLIISFVAGTKMNFLESIVNARVVRAMTNIAVRKNQGATAYVMGKSCDNKDKDSIERLFGYLGTSIEVTNEHLLDVSTAVSGSGIAYFIRIMKSFANFAVDNGMDRKTANKMIQQTVMGAASTVTDDYEKIIMDVCSRGGTTELGIKTLEEKGLDDVITGALSKTLEKAQKIGETNE